MGSSVIVTDSGKELQFMACKGLELGREIDDWEQNCFTSVLAKKVLQIASAGQTCLALVFFFSVWVAVC